MDAETSPAGNDQSSDAETSPAGNEQSSDAETSPAGNEQSSDAETSPAGNEQSSDAETSPAGNEQSSDAETSPAGNEQSNQAEDILAEKTEAARKALEEAGIALQTAGETLESASSEDEIAAAEAALAKARISVIVAGHDLAILKSIYEEQSGVPETIGSVIDNTQKVLDASNAAIIIASRSILEGFPEIGDFPQNRQGRKRGGRTGQLDKDLNDSLIIFDGQILEARRVLSDNLPAPSTSDNTIVFGSRESARDATREGTEETLMVLQEPTLDGDGSEVLEEVVNPTIAQIPEGLPDPQGDDIVAKQLREAAIAEKDPVLKEKLWEEYRRYRDGI